MYIDCLTILTLNVLQQPIKWNGCEICFDFLHKMLIHLMLITILNLIGFLIDKYTHDSIVKQTYYFLFYLIFIEMKNNKILWISKIAQDSIDTLYGLILSFIHLKAIFL